MTLLATCSSSPAGPTQRYISHVAVLGSAPRPAAQLHRKRAVCGVAPRALRVVRCSEEPSTNAQRWEERVGARMGREKKGSLDSWVRRQAGGQQSPGQSRAGGWVVSYLEDVCTSQFGQHPLQQRSVSFR